MPVTDPFEDLTDRYDEWFERHEPVYRAELSALSRLVDETATGVEVGVGTGRFAAPLDVDYGVDPARGALVRARERGVEPVLGVGERLPLREGSVDLVLFVTTICFVDDLEGALAEARRVLRPGGRLVVGYVDAESPLGHQYREQQADNPFYREATFHSTADLRGALATVGFSEDRAVQTIFGRLETVDADEPVREGSGEGSFVALAASPA